jgi:hypothetical protein
MSCNAWNHRPDCDCGWGGVFHASHGDSSVSYWRRIDSYTVPNAACPRCGKKVYFFRSNNGGCVYFEELGPPWPKHPCMDTDNVHLQNAKGSLDPGSVPSRKDESEHWRPLLCEVVVKKRALAELAVAAPEGKRILYPEVNAKLLVRDAPYFIRFVSKGVYEISTLTNWPPPAELRFYAYRDRANLTSTEKPKGKPLYSFTHSALTQPKQPPIAKKPRVRPSSVPVIYVNRGACIENVASSARTLHLPKKERPAGTSGGSSVAVPSSQQNHRGQNNDEAVGTDTVMAMAFKRARSDGS